FQPRAAGQAALVDLADTETVEHDLVAALPLGRSARRHRAGAVNPRDHRPAAYDRRAVGDGQAVLVVERGVLHVDGDVALRQEAVIDLAHGGREIGVLLEDQGLEHGAAKHSAKSYG